MFKKKFWNFFRKDEGNTSKAEHFNHEDVPSDSSSVSTDSEPEIDKTDEVSIPERLQRDLKSSSSRKGAKSVDTFGYLSAPSKRRRRTKWLRFNLFKGNPVFGTRMQLYCRTGYLLGIFPDKKVKGIDDDTNPNALVEFSSEDFGEVKIRGVQSKLYLAMNKKGKLYGEVNGKDEATIFVEYVYGQYNLYLSRKWAHLGWYVGIKKSGKSKPGPQTRYGQKAIQFLPRRKRF